MLIEHALSRRGCVDPQKGNRTRYASCAESRVCVRKLQRGYRDTVTMGHGGDTDRPPLRELGQKTRRLTRKATRGDLPETKVRERVPDQVRGQAESDMRHANVRA